MPHQNDLPHIDRLPPELLGLILGKLEYDRFSYRELFALRSVCTLWRDVVDGTPQHWTNLSLSYSDGLLSLILKNSKSAPLSVWYNDGRDSGGSVEPAPSEQIAAFITRTAPSSSRWKSLNYNASYASNHSQILGLKFDNLQRLTIALSGNITYTTPLDAPRLKDIHVHRCSLNWGSIARLRSLDIDQNTEGPTVEVIKDMLKASPDLEILKISRNWPRLDVPADPSPIYLPKLRSIYLSKVHIQKYAHLLNLIVAPNVQHFYFHYTNKWGPEDFTPILEAAARYVGADPENFDAPPSELVAAVKSFHIRLSTGSRIIDIQNFAWLDGPEGPSERLRYITATFKKFRPKFCNAIRQVALKSEGNGEIGNYCSLVHSFFPGVEELAVNGAFFEYPDAKAVMDVLGTAFDLQSWLLPGLVALRIKATKLFKYEDLLGMVEARKMSPHTKSITRVTFEDGEMNRSVVEKLRSSLETVELVEVELFDDAND